MGIKRLCLFVLAVLLFSGCHPEKLRRAWGYHKLDLVTKLLAPETFLPQHELLVRYDERGFSAMSTSCTLDLTALTPETLPDGRKVLKSSETESVYSWDGQILNGPAKAPLPYYRLEIKPGTIGASPDTLFARIGDEVSASWRLPTRAVSPQK